MVKKLKSKFAKVLLILGLTIVVSNNLIQFIQNSTQFPLTFVVLGVVVVAGIIDASLVEAFK